MRNLLLILIIPAAISCNVAKMGVHGGGSGDHSQNENNVKPVHLAEEFTADPLQRKVDILFVDDNSGSMDAMQNSLGSKFPSFNTAVEDLDWQIGITTTDCSGGKWGICGSLVRMSGTDSKVLSPKTPNFAGVFKNTIVRPETVGCTARNGECPSGDSVPLKAAVKAMEKHSGINKGFFRKAAALAIVILTNADEDNVAPIPSSTTPEMVVEKFRSIWGESKVLKTFAIAVLNGDERCLATQHETGLAAFGRYPVALASMTGGASVSICANDYSKILQQIGEGLSENVPNSVTLAHEPILKSLIVTLSPDAKVGWTLRQKVLTFDAPLAPGTKITINYDYFPEK